MFTGEFVMILGDANQYERTVSYLDVLILGEVPDWLFGQDLDMVGPDLDLDMVVPDLDLDMVDHLGVQPGEFPSLILGDLRKGLVWFPGMQL